MLCDNNRRELPKFLNCLYLKISCLTKIAFINNNIEPY